MVIDANMYWFPEEVFLNDQLMKAFLAEIPNVNDVHGYETTIENTNRKQIVIEKPIGYPSLNYAQGDYVLMQQLMDMDKAGFEKSILKIPGCFEWLTLDLCKIFNDGMANHVKQSKGRMNALAVVPPMGTPECIYELERCTDDLGMTGLQLGSHYGTSYLDDERFSSFFRKVNQLELTVYVHHSPVPVQFDSICEFNNLRRQYGRCMDQAIAVGRELFSGFFEKYPNIKLVHSMLGGGFFTYINMLFPAMPTKKEDVGRFESGNKSIREQIQNNLFFEMSQGQSWGKAQLECAVSVLGADHIIFGTSYPVKREWLLEGANFVKQLDISDEDKDLILAKNAQRIYQV
ncbi:MAG: amidohydrolase family protein [Anaerolineaceae bacterium]|nr:amidohydrolase family protein [Anaerolineaceae bacterium]